MGESTRWTTGGVRVTRVVGDHELGGADGSDGNDGRERRYLVDAADVTAPAATVERDGDDVTVRVPADVRLARASADGASVWLPGPVLGDALADLPDGKAARTVANSFPTPESAPCLAGTFLDLDGVADVIEAVAGTSQHAADALHGVRYPVARAAALNRTGLAAETRTEFERFVSRLDDADELGDVDVLDALCDVVAAAPTLDAARVALRRLGYDLGDLESRDDGRFRTVWLARLVRERGRRAAREYLSPAGGYDAAKRRALNADYWERGAAWREAADATADRSLAEFSFALANALHWTGEVARTDAAYPELLHAAAADVAAAVDLVGVEGRARYARHLAAGHRHRSRGNHDRAVSHFERARAVAAEYDYLDEWDPLYSASVVRANALAAADNPEGAVSVLEGALDEVESFDVPPNRRETILAHLRGGIREREAAAADGPGLRRVHLEAAREHYERAGLDRSVERVERELARDAGDVDDDSAERERSTVLPERTLRKDRGADARADEIPELRDGLVAHDEETLGSPDPGVVDDDYR